MNGILVWVKHGSSVILGKLFNVQVTYLIKVLGQSNTFSNLNAFYNLHLSFILTFPWIYWRSILKLFIFIFQKTL